MFMKRISIVFIATFCIKTGNAQSQNLKGTILPNNKNGKLFLPKASENQSSEQQEITSNIILVNGKKNPNK